MKPFRNGVLLLLSLGNTVPDGCTGLLPQEAGGWSRTNTRANIDVDQEKKVDLGVLRDADHDGRVQKLPLSTVDGVGLKFEVTP